MGNFIDQVVNNVKSDVEDELKNVKHNNVKFARNTEYQQILNNTKMTNAQKTNALRRLVTKLKNNNK